jgi:hypothetical protein
MVLLALPNPLKTLQRNRLMMKKNNEKRRYPPFFERMVPIVLGIIGVLIFVLLVIIFGVALGLL